MYKFLQLTRKITLSVSFRSTQTYTITIHDNIFASEEDWLKREQLKYFTASLNWTGGFLNRCSIRSVCLHGEGGREYVLNVAKDIPELREKLGKFSPHCTLTVDGTDLLFKLLPKRNYVLRDKKKKELQGSKDMKERTRIFIYVCNNALKHLKGQLEVIRTAKNLPVFRKGSPPLKYFPQKNSWSDIVNLKCWFGEVFYPSFASTLLDQSL